MPRIGLIIRLNNGRVYRFIATGTIEVSQPGLISVVEEQRSRLDRSQIRLDMNNIIPVDTQTIIRITSYDE